MELEPNRCQHIDRAEKNLQRLLEWIPRVDNKSSVVLGLNTAMFGALFAVSDPMPLWIWVEWLSVISTVVCFAVSLTNIYLTNFPRTAGPKNSLIYFGSIAELDFQNFREKFIKLSHEDYLFDLIDQCHRNAEILSAKFRHLKNAYTATLASILPWTGSIYLFSA